MWSSLLGLALLISLNPILLGVVLLIISRPQPVQHLIAYWAGAMTVNIPAFLTPLALLHLVPGFASFAHGFASPQAQPSTGLRPVPLGIAVVLLAIATVMVVRLRARRRADVLVGPGGAPARPGSHRAPETSLLRQLLGRLTTAWENGSLRVTYIVGMFYFPSLSLVLLIGTTIATSEASIGEQVGAAVAFVVGFLAVLEITLLLYVVAPERTAAVLQPVHDWARAHSRQILIAFFALAGLWQLARGLGIAA